MSSSVTMKALQSGWAVLSHTPGFFSTAADSWPVMGAALVCRALAMADRRVLSVHPGPTPEGAKQAVRGNSGENKVETEEVLTHWEVTPMFACPDIMIISVFRGCLVCIMWIYSSGECGGTQVENTK